MFPLLFNINDFNFQTNKNALASLILLNDDVILPPVIEKVIKNLNEIKIQQVTKDDYFTFLTPEEELYDKSVLPGQVVFMVSVVITLDLIWCLCRSDANSEINMKRESKVYSYKDQLEEMQLRRELEEKKRKEGKIKEPQYTPKQLEAIKNQKIKEQGIRNKLKKVNIFFYYLRVLGCSKNNGRFTRVT